MSLNTYPQRQALHNEIHARPPESIAPPSAVSHVVMLASSEERAASRAHLAELLRNQHLPMPDAASTHLRMDLGQYRLRWEMHTEFVTWTFIRSLDAKPLPGSTPPTASQVVPQAWLAALPGQCLASVHVWALPSKGSDPEDTDGLVKQVMREDTLVASTVADGYAEVYTDFAIHADGFSRMLLLTGGISTRRLGRLVQQLLEIETYRMAALMGLPAAREASEVLGNAERELAELAGSIRSASRDEEPQLLDRLTRLAGQVESQHATSHSRFSASSAYFELVDRRIDDIAESRLAGLQTIREFMDRRLSPARSTCQWATRRQDALSQRVSRISNLLRTRVEIEQQESSQALLVAMNERQGMQLKLQATVEGLSVVAITYYIVGLVLFLARGAKSIGWPVNPEVAAALAIPVVLFTIWYLMRRLRNKVFQK
ncbi:MAG: DUF3422 domain-containing protein [Polaromonas sp.]|nr:DUF3422 domain-containing protein [Polaromonas sp.]